MAKEKTETMERGKTYVLTTTQARSRFIAAVKEANPTRRAYLEALAEHANWLKGHFEKALANHNNDVTSFLKVKASEFDAHLDAEAAARATEEG